MKTACLLQQVPCSSTSYMHGLRPEGSFCKKDTSFPPFSAHIWRDKKEERFPSIFRRFPLPSLPFPPPKHTQKPIITSPPISLPSKRRPFFSFCSLRPFSPLPNRALSSMSPSSAAMASMNQKNKEDISNSSREFFVIDSIGIRSKLSYSALLDHFEGSLPSATELVRCPHRQQFSIDASSTLLLMPSWSSTLVFPYMGVKIVTSFPQNSARNLPGINASYLLFDSATGRPLSCIDGTEMTLWRTSCVSALAAGKLAREDAEVLVMVGAGSLAAHLIKAHLTVRPSLKRVFIWNRTAEKAISLVKKLQEEVNGVQFIHGASLDDIIGEGDVISCATSSEVALVEGRKLKNGVHLDLVGSFTPSMKECDDEAIASGRVIVDCEAALTEAGELVSAFDKGVILPGDIVATLPELIKGEKIGRSSNDQITVFKSVGSAVVDLLAAQLIYESHL